MHSFPPMETALSSGAACAQLAPTRERRSSIIQMAVKSSRPKSNSFSEANAAALVVDSRIEYEFGGPMGVLAIMVGFPILMYYMYLGAYHYNGKLPTPAEGQSIPDFLYHLVNLASTSAYPTRRAWVTYWTFFIFEAACYLLLPGITVVGKKLPHMGNKQLTYYCSGMWSFYTTIVIVAALNFTGLFRLSSLIDDFGSLMTVAILSGCIVSVLAYISTFIRGKTHRMTGNHIYDFFMGAELNPRMFGLLDFKMFFEVRIPWYILFLLTSAAATRQWELYGYVSPEVGFLLLAHYLYANACAKGEELIVTTWDMFYEKWGFMLIFWNLAGVPLSYCHCTLYLALHHPDEYQLRSWLPKSNLLTGAFVTAGFAAYLFVYWVWDTTNSQKNRFRASEAGRQDRERKAFPQLPWREVKNPRVIQTGQHNKLLADGWYGKARKIHYSCDTFFALSWGLVTGFASPFPWFYACFFVPMIIHRAWRDIERCKEKYGSAWVEYERLVPALFIPLTWTQIAGVVGAFGSVFGAARLGY